MTNEERNAEIYRRHKDGEGWTAISRSIGLSAERVRQIFHREEWLRAAQSSGPLLSVRSSNGLRNMGFPDPDIEPQRVAEMLAKVDNPKSLLTYNVGRKSLNEIMEWSAILGFPMKPLPPPRLCEASFETEAVNLMSKVVARGDDQQMLASQFPKIWAAFLRKDR